jgi:peptidoglycan/LPS O-acetylase OafA/YrhL
MVLAITLVLAIIHPPLPDYTLPGPGEIVGNMTALQMPAAFAFETFRIGFGINGPLWLVSVVAGFYAVLPFIAKPYFRHALIGLVIAAAITVCWKEAIGRSPELLLPFTNGDVGRVRLLGVDQLPSWAFSLGLGMTGAWAYVRANERWSPERLQRFAVLALPVALLLYVAAGYVRGRYALDFGGNVPVVARSHPFETLFESFSRAALMTVVVLGPAWMQRPFANRPTARLSELSYGVYLIHLLVMLPVCGWLALSFPDLAPLPRFVSALVLTCVLTYSSAWLCYRFIEEPGIALGRKIASRFQKPKADAALPEKNPA